MDLKQNNYEQTQEEINTEKNYEVLIKNRCFLCDLKFENNWDYYCQFGNSCRSCSARVNTYSQPKNRDRKDESVELLRIRKEAVKRGLITKNI